MGILFSLFFIVLFFVVLIILFVLGFIRSIFGFGRRKNNTQTETPRESPFQQKQRSKVFDKSEGEYADFEEIK